MNSPTKSARKVWQPYNRKSQILTAIVVLVLAGYQVYRLNHSTPNSSGQTPVSQPAK